LFLSDTSCVRGVVQLYAALRHDVDVLHEILDVYALGDHLQLQQKREEITNFETMSEKGYEDEVLQISARQ